MFELQIGRLHLKAGPVGGVILWLTFGMLYHLLTTEIFSWIDPWLYVTLVIWPIFLLGWMLAVIGWMMMMIAMVVGFIAVIVLIWSLDR